jgi:MinD-like ATPase involved in chromosome partitioning or flagellar assembly/tetratricopeptide (TPR) repeat protein
MNDTRWAASSRDEGRVVTFYSYKGGTGRTMTLANTAWILAANGKRVLTVDWDLEAPGLARFFHPFLDQGALASTGGVVDMINNYLDCAFDGAVSELPDLAVEGGRAAVAGHAMSLDWEFPGEGGIDFISAGRQNQDYSTILNGLNWDQFYQEYEGGTFLDALRAEMVGSYDFTLIDSRTGLSDSSKICTQHLPDDVVVCFTLSDQSIDGAVGVARHLDRRYKDRDLRILPVPMRVDEGEKERADRGRAVAKQRFRGFPRTLHTLASAQYWGSVEIPYRAYYAYEEVLAVFGDKPGLPATVLGATERLVAELTRGEVSSLPEMPEPVREAGAARFHRKAVTKENDSQFRLWYAVEDQMWADWVEFVLVRAGCQVTVARIDMEPGVADLLGSGSGRTGVSLGRLPKAARNNGSREVVEVPLLTRHFTRVPQAETIWGPVPRDALAAPRPRTIGLRLGSVQPGAPVGHNPPLDLSSRTLSGPGAAELLVRHVVGDDEAVGMAVQSLEGIEAPRYPGMRSGIISLQSRNTDFTGRAEELGLLRRRLLERDGRGSNSGAQALHGLGGVGKSQLAREYAYRYLADYDVVWWVPAEHPSSITGELAELAKRLDLRGHLSDTDAAQAARAALTAGQPYNRWLLIFDNAEDPESIREFLPGGEGHVIITSRQRVWQREATELEVNVFSPEESVAHLCRRVVGMEPAQAGELARVLGDLPLAVEHAAAYLAQTGMSVPIYLERLDSYPEDMFGEAPPADYPLPIKTTFAASLDQLEQEWPAAKRLLQLSVFLGPEPFSQTLVFKSPEMVRILSAHDARVRSSPGQLGGAINAVRKLSLAKVDSSKSTVQVHRVLQALLRMQMSEQEQREIRDDVRRVLMGQRPLGGEVENPENRPAFELIRPHLAACSAETSEEPRVRQLMIDLVRLQWRSGDFELARKESARIDVLWRAMLGENHPQTLELRCLRANILRDVGEYQQSLDLSRKTWVAQCTLLGEDDYSTLMTARGMAAGMRAVGLYQEALERDLLTYNSLRGQFVEEDGDVLSTAHNLAIDYRLIGDAKSAQRFDEQTLRTRRNVLGPDHDRTLNSQLYLARDKRDSGELRDAANDLERLFERYRDTKGEDHPDTLRAAKSLAVSLRVLGQYQQAAKLTKDAYGRYLSRYGEDHPDTWTCGLNLAADEWCTGDVASAVRRAEGIRNRFVGALGADHPNSLACADNVSVYLRSAGAAQGVIRRAVSLGEEAVRGFRARLGEQHPFTLCAEVNWTNARAQLDEELSGSKDAKLREVAEGERSCLDRLMRQMGGSHPEVQACRSNLAVTLRALGEIPEAQRLHDQAVRAFNEDRNFGAAHPDTVLAEDWQRISHVLELHSW